MKGKSAGGGTTTLDRRNPVDRDTYGPGAAAETFQPFWDDHVPWIDPDTNEGIALGIEGEINSSNPWDVVKLQGVALPGIWKATATPSIVVDVQKPNDFDGAALVSRGYSPGRVTITGKLWTPEQWAEFQGQLPTWWSRPNSYAVNDRKRQTGQVVGSQKAVSVEYPGLAAVGINAIVIQQITPPEETEKGVREIKIQAIEYVPEPQKKKGATKKTAGVADTDRSVQAQRIFGGKKAKGGGVSEGGAKVPNTADEPVPPSLGQAGAQLPKRPAYARH